MSFESTLESGAGADFVRRVVVIRYEGVSVPAENACAAGTPPVAEETAPPVPEERAPEPVFSEKTEGRFVKIWRFLCENEAEIFRAYPLAPVRDSLHETPLDEPSDPDAEHARALEAARAFLAENADAEPCGKFRESELGDAVFWFIGDVHCRLDNLRKILAGIRRERGENPGGPHVLVFLGDIFDRGDSGDAVLAEILGCARGDDAFEVHYVLGNHDTFEFDAEAGKFVASYEPADTLEQLNAGTLDRDVGLAALKFFETRGARAEIVGLGGDECLFVAHGGGLREDSQKAWLADESSTELPLTPETFDDFSWMRLSPNPLKAAPRGTRSAEFGVRNFDSFRALFLKKTGKKIVGFIRGHDHPAEGFSTETATAANGAATGFVLTLSACGSVPVAARLERGKPLEVVRF